MTLDDEGCYRALCARDTRFDGVFFVGVNTTGIYCRPVCTAKTPGRKSCQFYASAFLAERAGFRPCLRCRPELAPGRAPIDSTRTTAHIASLRIEAGALNNGRNLEELAANLGISSRQLRRAVRKELGASPVELAQTNRLLLAKRLIAETQLPLAQVAFAAGFESVRRFNAVFKKRYRLTPSALRRGTAETVTTECLRLVVAYRPPLDWDSMLRFLAARAIPGVECVTCDSYSRTVGIGKLRGWFRVTQVESKDLLTIELATALAPALPSILVRLRNLFDLDARPDIIAGHLALDLSLAPLIERHPGLRVPGAFDSFELGTRAILGQQVSVRAASTLAGRIAQRLGEAVETPFPCLNRIAPVADALATARADSLTRLGLPTTRAEGLRSLARVVARGEIDLEPGIDPRSVVAELVELPGIGAWTAEYIAMRALRWPDAFPAGDLGLKKALQLKSTKAVEKAAFQWRPWRAYAAMHLWRNLGVASTGAGKKNNEP